MSPRSPTSQSHQDTPQSNRHSLYREPDNQLQRRRSIRRPDNYYSDSDSEGEVSLSSSTRHSRRRSRSHHRSRSSDDRPSESYTVTKACKSAAVGAAVEALRCRAEPGPWVGQKGVRVATAALSGGLYGALRNGRLRADGKLPVAEAAISGLYAVDFLKRVLRPTEHETKAEEARGRARERKRERKTRRNYSRSQDRR